MTRVHDDDEQGEDRAEQQADGRGGEGDRLHGQGGRLPDAVPPGGGYLLPGGHGLARGELAEYAQHRGELRVGPEQASLDALKLVLLVVATNHDVLLSCRSAAGARCPEVRVLAPGQDPHRPGGQRRAGRRRVTAARLVPAGAAGPEARRRGLGGGGSGQRS